MNKFFKLAAATTFAATLVLAQTGTNRPAPPDPTTMAQMRVNRLATYLSLTDAQKAQAESIFLAAINASSALRTEGETLHDNLVAAIKANNSAGIDAAANALAAHEAKLTSIAGKAEAAFYAILTPDQQSKYHVGGGGRGMGGPMGGGMGPQFRGGPRP